MTNALTKLLCYYSIGVEMQRRFDLDQDPNQGFTVICEIKSIIGIRSEGMKGEFVKGVLTCGDH